VSLDTACRGHRVQCEPHHSHESGNTTRFQSCRTASCRPGSCRRKPLNTAPASLDDTSPTRPITPESSRQHRFAGEWDLAARIAASSDVAQWVSAQLAFWTYSNILQFLARADGEGGFAVVETDNPGDLAGIASKFAPYLIAQNYLVVEMEEWTTLTGAGIEFRG